MGQAIDKDSRVFADELSAINSARQKFNRNVDNLKKKESVCLYSAMILVKRQFSKYHTE